MLSLGLSVGVVMVFQVVHWVTAHIPLAAFRMSHFIKTTLHIDLSVSWGLGRREIQFA